MRGSMQTDAVRALDAQRVRLRGVEHRLLELAAHAGGDDDRGPRALGAQLVDQLPGWSAAA